MGEYARLRTTGQEVKIGTCENMYYLRYSQRGLVEPLFGSVDPSGEERYQLRYRFPFPDEDGAEPGEFGPYERKLHIPGAELPGNHFDHTRIQFRADAGYLVSLPCPEQFGEPGLTTHVDIAGERLTVHRNGFRGAFHIIQQKPLANGVLALVAECGGCRARFRIETWADVAPVVLACRKLASADEDDFWHTIADRITDGYRCAPDFES